MNRLPHTKAALNAARLLRVIATKHGVTDVPDVPSRAALVGTEDRKSDVWQRFIELTEECYADIGFLLRKRNLSEMLELPPTKRKHPERVLWEALFALLWEFRVRPLEKYQPLIRTLRAVHLLFGIDKPPHAGSVGYVKNHFSSSGPQRQH
jgi:hypothetical protein